MNDIPARKTPRLKNYDYSQAGAYFVTFCVKNKLKLLAEPVGAGFHARPSKGPTEPVGAGFHARPSIELTGLGIETQKSIEYIQSNNKNVEIPKYVIMPNHVHMIVSLLTSEGNAVGHGSPTLQSLVGRIKSYTTKRWNEKNGTKNLTFWQRSFYEHIIRNEPEYQAIWQYIDNNPIKWTEDEYHCR